MTGITITVEEGLHKYLWLRKTNTGKKTLGDVIEDMRKNEKIAKTRKPNI